MMTLEPKLLRAIDENLDKLVEMAEQVVEETKIANSRLEEHQLRNLESMANATDSVKVLKLFIRYQMGRHSEWRYNDFGNRVIEDFGKLEEMAKGLSQEQTRAVQIHLIRLYLGFLSRAFIARRPRE